MTQMEDLVLAYRILAAHGVVDAYGHASMRSPDDPGRYFISRSLAPELVTLDDIVELDLNSDPVAAGAPPLYLERFIHGEIYKAHPHIDAVIHNHSPSVIPFGAAGVPMRPLFNTAAFVGRGIPVFEIREFQQDGDVLIDSNFLGSALADVLGPHPAALMRGHGAVVVGASLPEAVIRSIYLEQSAKLQMQTMQIAGPGGKITYYTDAEVEAVVARQDAKQTWRRTWDLWRTQALVAMRKEQMDRTRAAQPGGSEGCQEVGCQHGGHAHD
jgi:ribulose-5-phosphate 4-epimerase/fuculose-1-phosphate aldolase